MACRLDRAIGNAVYVLKSATPTSTIVRNRWESYDPLLTDCPLGSAGLRKFFVEWLMTGEDEGATDLAGREVQAVMRVHVEYPTVLGWYRTQELIASDRHDLRKLLRDQDGWPTGWTNADGVDNASDETGIFNRWITGDEINRSERDKWRFTVEVRVLLRESES